MDGFDLSYIPASNKIDCTKPYQYVNPSEISEYWTLATDYALADNMFQTQGSGTFTAHQDLIAGGTVVPYGSGTASVIDNPSYFPWGCDGNPSSLKTSLITQDLQYLFNQGPFPCLNYSTMRDLLDAKAVSWKYYTEPVKTTKWSPGIWSAFDAISAVRYSKEWGKKVVWPDTKFFTDIHNGRLPAVSWITPDGPNSDHPQEKCKCDKGPAWVAQIVNAVGNSKYWNSTAIVVVWDDWGGFYDHVLPPALSPPDNQGGLGFRVPMLIVSPYVQPHVEHTQYEFGSILHFVEDNWNLGNLGRTDVRATSIGNAFNFNMAPRRFKPIAAKYSLEYFLHQKPSNLPPDTE
jgi:phospholipase C